MEYTKKDFLLRALIGGLCGLLVMVAVVFFTNSISILGSTPDYSGLVLVSHGTIEFFGSYALAFTAQSLLCFALGAAVGISTLPFAAEGGELLLRSLLHFGVTGLLYSMLLVLCLDLPVSLLPEWLGMLAALYLVIWLGRYVGWYVEVAQIRAKLGLDPGPSVLKWRETLPYLPFLVLLCVGLPLSAPLWDELRIPIFSQLFFPFLVLPAGCFAAGMSLGKRQGFCPLYPVLAFVLYLPTFFPVYNFSTLCECFLILGFALAGNTVGSVKRWSKQRRM